MPKVALAETVTDWDQLLRLAEPYGEIKELKVHLAELRAALIRLQELETLRNELQAKRQRATQERNELREAGKIVAIQIRSILKGVFGHANERLVQFNIRPRRSKHPRETLKPDPELAAPSE